MPLSHGSTLDTDLTLFFKMLKDLEKPGNICADFCCFHGHLSCFGSALSGETLSDVWPGPKTKKSASAPDWQASSPGVSRRCAELACWGRLREDLDSCTFVVMERLGLPARKELEASVQSRRTSGSHCNAWWVNKIKSNGINHSSSRYWWRRGSCSSPLAMLNLQLALLSVFCVSRYGTPTGALRGNGLF